MTPSDTRTATSARTFIAALRRRAGLTGERRPVAMPEIFERLEDRALLAGDEPNFNQVFNTPSPLTVPVITLDAGGAGASSTGSGMSTISPAGDDDVFRFTAPANDFVRIWADTRATGSTLDSRVEIYTGVPGGPATLVSSGSTQGTLTAGVFRDGWAGFIATAGTDYYVVVRSDVLSGTGSLGDYILRVNARSLAFPALDGQGAGSIGGSITLPGSDVVYKVTAGTAGAFNSVMTMIAQSDSADLDTRLDVYSSTSAPNTPALRLVADSDAGNLSNAYLVVKSNPNLSFYVRVRGDEFGDPVLRPSTGAFTLVVDGIGTNIALDPVTRLGTSGGRSIASEKDAFLFQFKSQGTGLSFITVDPTPFGPFGLPDTGVHIYDETGAQIGFNELSGPISRLEIQLQGGRFYWVVVENFDFTGGGLFRVDIEAHHTYDPNQPVDDHVNTPTFTPGQPVSDAVRHQFELATPVIWGLPNDKVTPPFPFLPDPSVDHSKVILGAVMGRIHAAGETDLFQFVAPVDMLGEFDGKDDGAPVPPGPLWQAFYRPAANLQIFAFGQTLFNAQVRIYDSNFAQVYPGNGTNDRVMTGPFADPAGVLDRASYPPQLPVPVYGYTFSQNQPPALGSLDIWGGEVYYLEISGAGSGRYDVELQVDAYEDKPTVSKFFPTLPNAGQFGSAREIQINPNSGEGRNYSNAAGGGIVNLGGGSYTAAPGIGAAGINLGRSFWGNLLLPTPPPAGAGAGSTDFVGTPGSRGRVIFQMSDLGLIQTPTDTDLYQFRALYTGTVEVRIATTQITDEYFEGIVQSEDGDPMTPPVIEGLRAKTKTYDSPLDGALRIFDNDLTQIGYNNDNSVTAGERDTTSAGTFARTFHRRDPRAVFNVISGQVYYIQVESGQRQNFSLTFPKVDWRHAIGSYELMVNSMSNLNFADDHINGFPANNIQATPIPISLSGGTTSTILGTATGEIADNLSNPTDTDLFQFLSPADGIARVTLLPANGASFDRQLDVLDAAGVLLGSVTVQGTQPAEITVQATQGRRIFVRVGGGPTNGQGQYVVNISGVPFIDDHSSLYDFFGSTEIDKNLYDFDGTETVNGRLESDGDTDIFTFQSIAYDVMTITVRSQTPGFDPFVRIYEIGEDGAGNPVLLQIAFNDDESGTSQDSRISFSVTAPPRTSGSNGDTFNNYFAVVSGFDVNSDKGNYTFTVDVNVTTDDHPDAGQYAIASPINLSAITGIGNSSGVIELAGDTDLFQFTTLSQGLTTVTLTSPSGSLLLPRVRIFDDSQNPVASLGGAFFITGPDQDVSSAVFQFTAQRGVTYYVQAEGAPSFGNTFKTAITGAYTVRVVSPIPDDHPNEGEFSIADDIPISQFSGDGSAVGIIETGTDTDLFRFTTLSNVSGNMVITIDTPSSQFRPVLRLFNPDTSPNGLAIVDGGTGDEDGQVNGSVTRTLSSAAGTTYYLLVSSEQSAPILTGAYTVTLNGIAPPAGPDDHANAGDWGAATLIPLSQLTGDATANGNIEIVTDSDLFYFNSLSGTPSRPTRAFVHVVTPAGSTLDVGVRIYKQTGPGTFTLLVNDSAGGPGNNAQATFDIDATTVKYFIEVDELAGTGTYVVKVDTAPDTFVLYYPEGFANSNIREYISIGNDNDFDVHFTVRLRYESNDPEHLITGLVPAGSRGGVTISDGTNDPGSGVLFNKPYAIIIESDGFLGANISHYDFGNTLGEAFTGRTSTTWSFAEGNRHAGEVADFLLYYNPNPNPVVVTLTAYQTDPVTHTVTSIAMSQTVQAFRRLGWNFDDTAQLPLGSFSFMVTSAPLNASDPHIGIVAALSHNDLANSDGYAVLGDPDSGSTVGVTPGIITGTNVEPMVFLFNSSNTAASVGLIGKYINNTHPAITRSLTLAPHESRLMTASDLGLVPGEVVGLRYDANTNITMMAATRQNGDADATQAGTRAARSMFFGDAFINRFHAGTLYFEDLYFYNPDTAPLPVTLTFVFNDGFTSSVTVDVNGKDFAHVALHSLQAAIGHRVFAFFSVVATAERPFVADLTHYDLVLAGGWRSQGAPLGLSTPLSTI